MLATIKTANRTIKVNLNEGIDISIPLRNSKENPTAWYVDPPSIEPVRTQQFTGAVAEGGSVNFRNISFNPHGHGTHTECVGHITEEVHSVNQSLKQFFFLAEVVSLTPMQNEQGDRIIKLEQIRQLKKENDSTAIIIRTLPNTETKLSFQYSDTNPPYLEKAAIEFLIDTGINHLLIDQPSVDREVDGGELAAHHAFWEHPQNTNFQRTITELIYVPNEVEDGLYLLNLQIASFENDATPSKPILYSISS